MSRSLKTGLLACAVVPMALYAGETISYGYDAQDRLVLEHHSGTTNDNLVENYGFDDSDNRTNLNVAGAPNP